MLSEDLMIDFYDGITLARKGWLVLSAAACSGTGWLVARSRTAVWRSDDLPFSVLRRALEESEESGADAFMAIKTEEQWLMVSAERVVDLDLAIHLARQRSSTGAGVYFNCSDFKANYLDPS